MIKFDWFKTIKRYYDLKKYTDEEVKVFVDGEKISKEEYKQITNVDYVE